MTLTRENDVTRMSNPELREMVRDDARGITDKRASAAKNVLIIRNQIAPDGGLFVWGTITEQHKIGPYTVVEYQLDHSHWGRASDGDYREILPSEDTEPHFSPFVGSERIGTSYRTLDEAIIRAIAHRHMKLRDGINAAQNSAPRATRFFMLMVAGRID